MDEQAITLTISTCPPGRDMVITSRTWVISPGSDAVVTGVMTELYGEPVSALQPAAAAEPRGLVLHYPPEGRRD